MAHPAMFERDDPLLGRVRSIALDLPGHFERTQRNGALILYPPCDQPYGYREYSARDCEGHLWSFMKAID